MGKTRELLKKIRDTNGTFHAKMGTVIQVQASRPSNAEEAEVEWIEMVWT